MSIEIRLLGTFQVNMNGCTVTRYNNRTRKHASLLAYLAYHLDKPVERTRLIELFWNEPFYSDRENLLSQALGGFRKELQDPDGPPVLLLAAGAVQLNPDIVMTDVSRFKLLVRGIESLRHRQEDLCDDEVAKLLNVLALYGGSLIDEAQGDAPELEDSLYKVVDLLIRYFLTGNDPDGALEIARAAVQKAPLHEPTYLYMMQLLIQRGQSAHAMDYYRTLCELLKKEQNSQPTPELRKLAEDIRTGMCPPPDRGVPRRIGKPISEPLSPSVQNHPTVWNPQPAPDPFVAREGDLERVKTALGIGSDVASGKPKVISVHGLPGVGKSTFTAYLTQHPDIWRAFPDTVLWSAFGQFDPDKKDFEIRDRLRFWGGKLGADDLNSSMQPYEMVNALAEKLRHRRALLICDDVWDMDHIVAIRSLVGVTQNVRLLVTSRITAVANGITSSDGVIKMDVFSPADAIDLLGRIAPEVVAQFPEAADELVHELQCLPLAINVAGRMLKKEMSANLDVLALIKELHKEGGILRGELPIEMRELIWEVQSPTIAEWLKRSTRMLDAETRRCFVSLGNIAPKPATFGLSELAIYWEGRDVKAIIRKLVDAGLLQAISDGRYQMHDILVKLAKSMRRPGNG